jgi:hypothetical protein
MSVSIAWRSAGKGVAICGLLTVRQCRHRRFPGVACMTKSAHSGNVRTPSQVTDDNLACTKLAKRHRTGLCSSVRFGYHMAGRARIVADS